MIKKIAMVFNSEVRSMLKWSLGIILILSPVIFPQAHLDDEFAGSYRKRAKTSIVRSLSTDHISRVKKFDNLDKLLIYLPRDEFVRDKYPDLKIHSGDPQRRKIEELHNVEVTCWVHAVKYEGGNGDRDFHIIVGDLPDTADATFMNVEVSGLPPATSHNYQPLKEVRKEFLDLFEDYNFTTSFKRIDPPRKVKIKGSLFFDGGHNHSCGTCPGPSYAKPGTVWEIHPIYSIIGVN